MVIVMKLTYSVLFSCILLTASAYAAEPAPSVATRPVPPASIHCPPTAATQVPPSAATVPPYHEPGTMRPRQNEDEKLIPGRPPYRPKPPVQPLPPPPCG